MVGIAALMSLFVERGAAACCRLWLNKERLVKE